jgi:hypothetical protein
MQENNIFASTSTDRVLYRGDDIPEIGIQSNMSITDVTSRLATHFLQTKQTQEEFNRSIKDTFNDGDILLTSESSGNVRGKYDGSIDIKVQAGTTGGAIVTIDMSAFCDSITDSIVGIETNIYGSPDSGRTLISSSNKRIYSFEVEAARFPLYGSTSIRVWEVGGDVTYVANINVPSANVMSYAYDISGSYSSSSIKSQSELNKLLLEQIAELKSTIGQEGCEIDGVKYNTWKQACVSLSGQCSALKKEIDGIKNGSVTISSANCGEKITLSGCTDC